MCLYTYKKIYVYLLNIYSNTRAETYYISKNIVNNMYHRKHVKNALVLVFIMISLIITPSLASRLFSEVFWVWFCLSKVQKYRLLALTCVLMFLCRLIDVTDLVCQYYDWESKIPKKHSLKFKYFSVSCRTNVLMSFVQKCNKIFCLIWAWNQLFCPKFFYLQVN